METLSSAHRLLRSNILSLPANNRASFMINLTRLSNQELYSEAYLAADLTRNAAERRDAEAESEAYALLEQLLTEIECRFVEAGRYDGF